jgi:ABC exporter DevB family membrane fusion protein
MIRAPARLANTLLSFLVGASLGLAAGGAGVWFYFPRQVDPNGNASGSGTPDDRPYEVPALGRLEPLGGIINVYGTPGDRVVRFLNRADEVGTPVKAGARLVEMAGDSLRAKEVAIAARQLADAETQLKAIKKAAAAKKLEVTTELKNLEQSKTAEINGQKSKLDVARLQVVQGETQLARVRSLSPGTIPRSDLEQQELLVRKGQAEVKAAEEALKAAEQALEDGKKLADAKRQAAEAEEERAIQAVPIESLKLALEAAQEKERIGSIEAPVAGTVVRVQVVPGETVSQVKPILQLAGGGDLVVRAEVPDAEVGRVHKILAEGGTITATITSRTVKNLRLTGELSKPEQLAQAISRNAIVGLSPGAESDRRVVEATLTVRDTDREMLALARSVLGLQVEVSLKMPGKK